MHLIFIRHGDPDYKHNALTPKGRREAALLAERAAGWQNVQGLYVSPYGRAQDTAAPVARALGLEPETLPWLKEFDWRITDPATGRERGCWDWLPSPLFAEPRLLQREGWLDTPAMRSGNIAARYRDVCAGLDAVLARYGYARRDADAAIYTCPPHLTAQEAAVDTHLLPLQKNLDERVAVFVCHLGSMFTALSHLLGVSPVVLWQGFFVAPASVTVLGVQERVPGEALFRVQMLGDVRHLAEHGEPVSASGFYGNVTAF